MIERKGIGRNFVLGKTGLWLPSTKPIEPWSLGKVVVTDGTIASDRLSASDGFDGSGDWAFGLWYKHDLNSGKEISYFFHTGASGAGVGLKTNETNYGDVFVAPGSSINNFANIESTVTKFNHFAFSYNSSTTTLSLYVNGSFKTSVVVDFVAFEGLVKVLGVENSQFHFNAAGKSSDAFFVPRQINSAEVAALYNNRQGADVMEVLPDATHNYRFNGTNGDTTVRNYGTYGSRANLTFASGLGFEEFVVEPGILLYNPLHVWSSENLTISDEQITANDFAGNPETFDLTNPALNSKPVYNESDPNFNSKPSLYFDGIDDYLWRQISSFRNTDMTGFFVEVFNLVDANSSAYSLAIADTDNNQDALGSRNQGNRLWLIRRSPINGCKGDSVVNNNESLVKTTGSRGDSYFIYKNETDQSLTFDFGSNTGEWLNGYSSLDNISIGGIIRPILEFQEMRWAFAGYFPYQSEANTLEVINYLKEYYGIN